MSLTVGSLFAGIGGFDLAAERAGLTVKWQVEIDPFCRRVLEKHWPHVRRYEDVRTVGAELERVDVICGGFPCQDISVAGRGDGITGERSGLWKQFDRLIGELRPRYVVVENVSALLARGLGTVLGDLAARRYDAEWDCIPASAVGARHQRDRVWVVAYAESSARWWRAERRQGGDWRFDVYGSQGDVADTASGIRQRATPRQAGHAALGREDVADAHGKRGRGGPSIFSDAADAWESSRRALARQWDVEPDVGRVAHGVPARVDRLRGLGNAIVPQVAEWIFRRIVEAEAQLVADCAVDPVAESQSSGLRATSLSVLERTRGR